MECTSLNCPQIPAGYNLMHNNCTNFQGAVQEGGRRGYGCFQPCLEWTSCQEDLLFPGSFNPVHHAGHSHWHRERPSVIKVDDYDQRCPFSSPRGMSPRRQERSSS